MLHFETYVLFHHLIAYFENTELMIGHSVVVHRHCQYYCETLDKT